MHSLLRTLVHAGLPSSAAKAVIVAGLLAAASLLSPPRVTVVTGR